MAIAIWSAWYLLGGGESAVAATLEHWRVALTMVFGSFIAGATSEGGGAIAFPVFTKVLQIDPADAKVFSLAIQSVGMSAASLVIIAMGVRVEWRVIRWAGIAGIPGMILGAAVVAPLLSSAMIKMSFTFLVTSFAVTLFMLNRRMRLCHDRLPNESGYESWIIALAGFVGGVMTGLVGNGIDIITFSVMVLLFRVSEKISTPTSVILMASNSIVGFLLHIFVIDGFTPEIREWWLAAIPVVVVGAPLGAMLCSLLDRQVIAKGLILLILIEFISSLWLIPMTPSVVSVSLIMLVIFSLLYYGMYSVRRYEPMGSD